MTRKSKKVFERGQIVDVQREPGWTVPWEHATYVEPIEAMKGWHEVTLHGEPRYIDSMTGMETDATNPRGYMTKRLSVPTQRVRVPKVKTP